MRIAVICIGNELLMDEGVGPACARYIESRYELPENVDVLDRSVMGMSIISDLRHYDFALVADAVEVPGARPGQLFHFDPDDAAPTPPGALSLHEMRFADVIASAELLGVFCDGHCFGVQVENMSPSEFIMALTPRVAAAIPLMAQAIVRYLRGELGCEVADVLARDDPFRAGSGSPDARRFDGHATAATWGSDVCVPSVYGDPDTGVMAEYLAGGLAAVGAQGRLLDDHAGPDGVSAVRMTLPVGVAGELAGCFGLQLCGIVEGAATVDAVAYVSAGITDYDCDALIGTVKGLL